MFSCPTGTRMPNGCGCWRAICTGPGFEVFLDEWELVGGDRVTGRLEEGIRGSANGVLVVSPHSLSRPWVREEYEALLRQAVQQPGAAADPGAVRRRGAAAVPGEPAVGGFPRGGDARARSMRPGWGSWCGSCRAVPAADRPARDGAVQWPAGAGGEVVRPAGPLRAELTVSADGGVAGGRG